MDDATLVYDDDCGFCTWCADAVADRSDVRVVGFSELTGEMRDRLPENYEECSHLVTDDGVHSCGASVERALLRSEVGEDVRPLVEFLRNFDDYARLRERAYRAVADRRSLFGQLLHGEPPAGSGSDTRGSGTGD